MRFALHLYEVVKFTILPRSKTRYSHLGDLNTRRGDGEKFARSRSKRVEEYRSPMFGEGIVK